MLAFLANSKKKRIPADSMAAFPQTQSTHFTVLNKRIFNTSDADVFDKFNSGILLTNGTNTRLMSKATKFNCRISAGSTSAPRFSPPYPIVPQFRIALVDNRHIIRLIFTQRTFHKKRAERRRRVSPRTIILCTNRPGILVRARAFPAQISLSGRATRRDFLRRK